MIPRLDVLNTKLANHRTYLAYMRTGFAIAGIAGSFKKFWIVLFGMIMVIASTVQYAYINRELNQDRSPDNDIIDLLPVIYVPLGLGTLYLQMYKK